MAITDPDKKSSIKKPEVTGTKPLMEEPKLSATLPAKPGKEKPSSGSAKNSK